MKAVILEDESLIARELQHKIAMVAPDVDILAHVDSLEAARTWLAANPQPDLFFMDIQLGDGVSFELFGSEHISCPVIFTTAYDDYAIQAFKVNGVDYLLKPIETDELRRAIDKVCKIHEVQASYPNQVDALVEMLQQKLVQPKYKEKFVVNFRKQWIPINTRDIAIFLRDNLNYLVTWSGEKHILDFTTLEEVEELLDPNLFFRANRQTIVHIDSIKSVKPLDNATLDVTLKEPLQNIEVSVGRAKAPAFKKWFDR
jgi:DNA-binding LytR/AlgR family response regulator